MNMPKYMNSARALAFLYLAVNFANKRVFYKVCQSKEIINFKLHKL